MLTKADIHQFLKDTGIKQDDTVLVHTSMRAIGEVEGGCDGLIDGFTSYLTDGLFIVPTHTWGTVGRTERVYDVRTSVPCIGAFPTVAAFRKDAIRSLHPTHSVAAFGKRVAEFVKGEELSKTPCPMGGLWARLYDEDAKILLLGVLMNRNTYIHAVDEMIGVEGKLREDSIALSVIGYEGERYEIPVFHAHYSGGAAYFENYRKPLETLGALKRTRLGNARVSVFYAKPATEILKKLWSRAEYDLSAEEREIPEDYYRDFVVKNK